MKTDITPNLFIVGAPKCGTTALSEYLRKHPSIFMCYPKEPHFFSDDFKNLSIVNNLEEYMALFKSYNYPQTVSGEASAWYLYSKNALTNIYNHNKHAKIIVILRNPIEIIQSLHYNFVFSHYENEVDIYEAWKLQEDRRKGKSIPKYCRDPVLLQYRDVVKLGAQMENLYSIFPKKQIKCILFDDFIENTKDVYESVISFLGLESDNRSSFPIINKRKEHRFKLINKYLLNPPAVLQKKWVVLKKIFGNRIIKVADRMILMNTKKPETPNNLSEEFLSLLRDELSDDNHKLSNILGKDLSVWLR